MSAQDTANLVVIVCLILMFANWAVLVLFVAPVAFPDLTSAMFRAVRRVFGGG